MGLENREYMRDESRTSYGSGTSRAMQDIVKTLIVVNAIIFLAQVLIKAPISLAEFPQYYETGDATELKIAKEYQTLKKLHQLPDSPLLNQWFTLDIKKVFQGQIWRLTTYDFLHSTGSFWHILFNMWLLYLAGKPVADKYGQREFLWFYLLGGIFSAVFYIAWGLLMNERGAAVGASGAVSAVLVLYAMNWPRQQWYIYGIIPVPVIALVLISGGMDLFPMLQQLSGGNRTDNIAHSAHIGGMLFGFLYYKSGWRLTRFIPGGFSLKNWVRVKRKPKLKIHRPEVKQAPELEPRLPIPAAIAQRVDELLDKISRSGEASLTAEEREFLHSSSRKYR